MPFRPLHNAVTVRRAAEEDRVGLIYLPETRTPMSHIHRGVVVAAGDGRQRWVPQSDRKWLKKQGLDPLSVAPGDEILYAPQYQERKEIDGELLDVVAEEFILAVVTY
jgi:co-chaperonin GroES (HSP10)